jgi:hypothetical protein
MRGLNGFSEVLRGSEKFFMTSEKFSVYFSDVYNPTPPHPTPCPPSPSMGWVAAVGLQTSEK